MRVYKNDFYLIFKDNMFYVLPPSGEELKIELEKGAMVVGRLSTDFDFLDLLDFLNDFQRRRSK